MDFDFANFAALAQVVLLDLALAGDNAIAVGLAAAGLPPAQRRQAIIAGIGGALVLRIIFALAAVSLLRIHGLLLVGGLLLFWVAWRMWVDLKKQEEGPAHQVKQPDSFWRALLTIIIADVSMSLDNVLAVAGVARHFPVIMAIGLVLSVVLMGVAANIIAKMIEKYRWIALVGILVILIAGVQMVWEDLHNFFPSVPAPPHVPGMEPAH